MTTAVVAPVFDRIVGQESAVRFLRASLADPVHAYLFVGPEGTGREEAASCFAAALFCPLGGCGTCATCTETLAGRHPDLVLVERKGAAISVGQAAEVARLALRSPRAAPYQVLVLVDFDLLGQAAPSLLKTIEEPPASTIIVVTAESVPSDFVTIASRCARVEFRLLNEEEVARALVQEGAGDEEAEAVASAARGRLDRARLLRADEGFSARLSAWRELPLRLDGTGATAARVVAELLEAAERPVEVVRRRQLEELEQLSSEAKAAGERSLPGRAEVEARHRREQRRARTDELRAGLAALQASYRNRLGEPGPSQKAAVRAIELIDEAAARLLLNVNEALLLEWLALELDTAP